MEDWEKAVTYLTFGLNAFFLLLLAIYLSYKFCFNTRNKTPIDVMAVNDKTIDNSQAIEMPKKESVFENYDL